MKVSCTAHSVLLNQNSLWMEFESIWDVKMEVTSSLDLLQIKIPSFGAVVKNFITSCGFLLTLIVYSKLIVNSELLVTAVNDVLVVYWLIMFSKITLSTLTYVAAYFRVWTVLFVLFCCLRFLITELAIDSCWSDASFNGYVMSMGDEKKELDKNAWTSSWNFWIHSRWDS